MEDRYISNKANKVYTINVTGRGIPLLIQCEERESLLMAMTRQGIYMSAVCGGRGTCGKCRIQVHSGELEITPSDRKIFTEAELVAGWRLSCKAIPSSDCTIQLTVGDEADFEIVADQGTTTKHSQKEEDQYGIAIDIGTTTIAVSLIEVTSKDTIQTYTTVNKQRAYGADVIARMQASNEGKLKELKKSIQTDLLLGIKSVVENSGIDKNKICSIDIAGNTTMGHLLLGYSCKTLGVYPFTPVNIDTTILSFSEVFDSDYLNCNIIMLPGISTYVGADIVSGLLECSFDKTEAVSLLIDIGTNGEMAIGNKDKILVCSTAAGPAFEGGNIFCGVGSIVGAICNVDIKEDRVLYKTIGNKAPIGICGTGVIEMVAELVKEGLVDETGLLNERYFDNGYQLAVDEAGKEIRFTQRDVREVQLAKAAVRAGIEILIRNYHIGYEDINTVYLAGGFGYKINIEKAVEIGLIPKQLMGKIQAIGNSSLNGAIKYLTQEDAPDCIKHIISISDENSLSGDEEFNELYMEHMYFE